MSSEGLIEHYKLDVELHEDEGYSLQHSHRRNRDLGRLERITTIWKRGSLLDQGPFSEVWQEYCDQSDGTRCLRAVKQVKNRPGGPQIDLKQELLALVTLAGDKSRWSEFLVAFQGWYEEDHSIFYVMEYLPYGDLTHHLSSVTSEDEVKQITIDLLEGLKIIHTQGFIHRDLKPSHILVVGKPPQSKRWWVKIGGFSTSSHVDNESALLTFAGTFGYMAPELDGFLDLPNESVKATGAADLWSLGCVIYYISTGNLLFERVRDLHKFCMQPTEFPGEPLRSKLGATGISFMQRLLNPEPVRRITVDEALEHDWLLDTTSDSRNGRSLATDVEKSQLISQSAVDVTSSVPDAFTTFASAPRVVPIRENQIDNSSLKFVTTSRDTSLQSYRKAGYSEQEIVEMLNDADGAGDTSPEVSEKLLSPQMMKFVSNDSTREHETETVSSLKTDRQNRQSSSLLQTRRVTWKCGCGEELYDDYIEIVPGSLDKLEQQLRDQGKIQERSQSTWLLVLSGIRQVFTGPSPASNTGRTPASSTIQQTNSASNSPPSISSSNTGNAPASENSSQGQQMPANPSTNSGSTSSAMSRTSLPSILYLLLCLPTSLSGFKLHHEQIWSGTASPPLSNDRQLFMLLRTVYISQRSTLGSRLSLRTVTNVSMTRFLVDMSRLVDLKPHKSHCTISTTCCSCMPPRDLLLPPNAEYLCDPIEPEFSPPIGPTYLTHAFQHPETISPQACWVLNQIPKRTRGQLMAVTGTMPIKGWGLSFEEGWHRRRVRHYLFVLSGLGSLMFGVLWSVFKQDVSAAFTVATYLTTFFAIVAGYLGTVEGGPIV